MVGTCCGSWAAIADRGTISPEAVVVMAAASASERDEWMAILQRTLGVKYHELSSLEQQLADTQLAAAVAQKYSQEQ